MLPEALRAELADAHKAGVDFAAELGIVKWVPPVPISMSGEVEPASDLLPWIGVENLKRYPAAFADGEPVAVTEKVHGTACCVTYHAGDDRGQMTSKALGAQRLALVDDPGSLYWRAVRGHRLPRVAAESAGELGGVTGRDTARRTATASRTSGTARTVGAMCPDTRSSTSPWRSVRVTVPGRGGHAPPLRHGSGSTAAVCGALRGFRLVPQEPPGEGERGLRGAGGAGGCGAVAGEPFDGGGAGVGLQGGGVARSSQGV